MTVASDAPGGLPRWYHPMAGAVTLAAFVWRVLYALVADPQIFGIGDAAGYRLLGHHLSEGRGYIRPFDFALDGVVRPTAEFPPGFPTLLAVFDAIGLDSITEQRVGLAALGAATVAAIIVLARRFLSPGAAIAVGAVAAFHPALFQPETALLGESAFLTATVVLLLAVVDLQYRVDATKAVAVGLIGGGATLIRSEGVVLALLAAAPLLVRPRRPRILWRPALALLVSVGLVLGIWAGRNAATFDHSVLVSNNLGSALDGANCPATYQGPLSGFWLISDECFEGFTQAELAQNDESIVAAAHRDQGLEFANDHRGELPRVMAIRVLRTFQLYEPEQQARLATFEGRKLLTERIGGWIAWATYPLAIAGLVITLRRRQYFSAWILSLPIAVVALVSAVTYGNPRFRIAAEVPMLVLAAIAVAWAFDRARGRGLPTT